MLPGMNETQSSWFRMWADSEWVTLLFPRPPVESVTVIFKRDTPATAIGSIFYKLQEMGLGWRFDHSIEWGGDIAYSIKVSLTGKTGFDIQ